tara:strand:- start:107 stop:799 length:693 start_codon:yes stop_codon:yes gene_type:complete
MALTKVNSAGVKDNELVNADIHTAANIAGSKLADNGVSLSKLFQHNTTGFIATNTNADCTVPTFPSHSGDTFIVHDLQLQRDASNANPVISAGPQASIRYETATQVSGAFGSILDTSGLQLGRNTQYVKIVAPSDQSGQTSYTLTLPPIPGNAGQALVTDGSGTTSWANTSSAEVYGFNTDANGNLIVTTTNGGADNISGTAFDAFEDVIFAATGFTFSVNANGKLIATI